MVILLNGEGKIGIPIQTYTIFFKLIQRIKILMKKYFKSNEEEKECPHSTKTLKVESERQVKGERK